MWRCGVGGICEGVMLTIVPNSDGSSARVKGHNRFSSTQPDSKCFWTFKQIVRESHNGHTDELIIIQWSKRESGGHWGIVQISNSCAI